MQERNMSLPFPVGAESLICVRCFLVVDLGNEGASKKHYRLS